MKTVRPLLLSACVIAAGTAQADTVKDMVRLACVPEAGLLDIEYRYLHDSVAYGPEARADALAQAGFRDPHGFRSLCVLGDISYVISTDQGPTSGQRCGGSPEVSLTVTRNGAPFVTDVVLGISCHELASVMRLTIGDGPKSSRGRETQICVNSGKRDAPDRCRWTFDMRNAFARDFPVDQDRVQSMTTR